MTHRRLHRRDMLVGSAVMAAAAAGCSQQAPKAAKKPATSRKDVPLRVVLMSGSAKADQELIERGWAAVTEQPLEIHSIEIERIGVGEGSPALSQLIKEAARKSDVLVYPLSLTAELSAANSLTAVSDSEFKEIGGVANPLFPSVRNGIAKYGGENLSVPLGALLPALLIGDGGFDGKQLAEDAPTNIGLASWDDYDERVQQWGGAASEPTEAGWAGAMFLWRAVTTQGWLFSREDFSPLIERESYVNALDLMKRTHDRYQRKRASPNTVWDAIKTGELKGGIGFEAGQSDGDAEIQVRSMPGVGDVSRILFDPFSPVISLSSSCRQSAAAKTFIAWLGGGETSLSVRKQIPGMSLVRGRRASGDQQSEAARRSYDQWLAERLETPVTLPTLRLLRADEYYQVLDHQVGQVLDGMAAPADALSQVAKEWQALTSEVGADQQLRAWLRAQGMRA